MSRPTCVCTNATVLPDSVALIEEPRPTKPVDRFNREVRCVGAHVARLAGPTYRCVVSGRAVVRQPAKGLVPEAVPKPL